ncbi:hypothetical protein QYF36_001323 [Acer negundo]|nr:hypothetical protein QYF36_001323 [Acer negundo]
MVKEDRARLREFLHRKCKSGKIDLLKAFYFFDCMIHMQPTPPMSSFNNFFTALGLFTKGRPMEATRLLNKMIVFGCRPDVVTFATLIHGLCRSDNPIVALELHEHVVNGNSKYGVTLTFGTLIRSFIQNNERSKVVELLHEMANSNLILDASIVSMVIEILVDDENYHEFLNSLPSFPVQETSKKLK